MIDEALRQLAQWRHDGVVTDDFWLSVNMSPAAAARLEAAA